MNIKRMHYFCMALLLVTSKNGYSTWLFTKTQPSLSLKQKVVNIASRYPLATTVVAAPLVTSVVYAYKNKQKVKRWLNANKTSVIAGLTALGSGLYVAQRKGYVSKDIIKSILNSAGRSVHKYRGALAATEVGLAAYLSGIFAGKYSFKSLLQALRSPGRQSQPIQASAPQSSGLMQDKPQIEASSATTTTQPSLSADLSEVGVKSESATVVPSVTPTTESSGSQDPAQSSPLSVTTAPASTGAPSQEALKESA